MHSICPFHNGNREAPKLPSDIQDAGILKTDVPRCNHSVIRHQTVLQNKVYKCSGWYTVLSGIRRVMQTVQM